MSLPGVNINVSSGNLLRGISVLDGIGAIVATVASIPLIGKVQKVYNLKDAVSKGYNVGTEPFMYNLIKEFYQELGGNQLLYVMGVGATTTMEDVVDNTNENGLKRLLTTANGEVNLVAVARQPDEDYDAGNAFLDADVSAAVTMSKTLCEDWQARNMPVRILIEGRVANGSTTNAYEPNTASNGYAGVVLGGTDATGSAAVTLALARACKYGAQIKIGNGQNGALTASQIYIGSGKIEYRMDLETLHDAGFIIFMHRQGYAGYYFGVDNMCSDDDYKILAHGRVIDKAQRVVTAALMPFVENDIQVDADGSPDDNFCSYLEKLAEQQLRSSMGKQVSAVEVVVDPLQGSPSDSDPDTQAGIVNTGLLKVQVKVLPRGYATWLTVDLGLTSSL